LWRRSGLENDRYQVHIQRMINSALKIIAGIGLMLISGGAWPYGRYSAAIIIGASIVAAGVLHFVAP